jgi:hypothetical protein
MFDSSTMPMSAKAQENLFRNIVELSTLLREAQMAAYSVTLGMPDAHTFVYQDFLRV